MYKKICKNSKGIVTLYLLIFASIFLILFGGLFGMILTQLKNISERAAWNESLNVAEAGINYYFWCLNNGVSANCLGERDYTDPSGNLIGKFSLQASSTISCGQDIKEDIVSTGWTNKFPQTKRKLTALYARTSVGQYSYILDSDVWIGSDHDIRGPYHSNGGIRMDGANQSIITSKQPEWTCTDSICDSCPTSHGCHISTSTCVCPGVFTTTQNSNPGLFDFPVSPFNFTSITVDLALMKNLASSTGIYLPTATTIDALAKGYDIRFKSVGTLDVWIITGLSTTSAYSLEEGWHYDAFTTTSEYFYRNYNIPSSCSAIFVEDNVWPSGTVKGKVTLAAANLISTSVYDDIILTSNLDYTTTTGADGLALISERNILIGPQSPDTMILRGIFIAQGGRFGRNEYDNNFRNELDIYGSVVSKGRVGTQWTSQGHIVSGYTNRETYFDSNLIYNPPSFVPYIDPEFKIIDWREIK